MIRANVAAKFLFIQQGSSLKRVQLRERMGREASPSAAVLDSQSVKSSEKGAVETARRVTTPAGR
jgi:hypothetical protein